MTRRAYQISMVLSNCRNPAPSGFDELLWACDLHLVRGLRIRWSARCGGRANRCWQIYPQHDNAHLDKLHAFLDWLDAPSLRTSTPTWARLDNAPGAARFDRPPSTMDRLRGSGARACWRRI